jgi:hypothetical protein
MASPLLRPLPSLDPHERWEGPMNIETSALNELAYRRRVQHLWNCGPRAVAELLLEIGAERSIGAVIDEKLARYSMLDPATLKALGADRLPRPVLYLMPGRGRP